MEEEERETKGGGREGRKGNNLQQPMAKKILACKSLLQCNLLRQTYTGLPTSFPPTTGSQASYSPSAHPVIPSTVSSMGSTWILLLYFTSGKAVTLQHTGTSNKLQLKICNSNDILVYLSFSLVIIFFFQKFQHKCYHQLHLSLGK